MSTAPTASLSAASLRDRVAAVPVAAWLCGMMALSLALRLVVTAGHVAPRIFPDEYIYASLGRSIADGSLTIRGEPAGFPALLEPLLAAPLWLAAGDNVELGYRLTQGMHALAVSLVAIPVFLIARRLGLSSGISLGCAAFSLVLPALAVSPFLMADPVALPLALGAVAAGTAALERSTWRHQAAFVALAGLATFARVQYAVLPVAFLVAALVVARWDVRRLVREQRVVLAAVGFGAAGLLVSGPGRVLGYYEGILDLHVDPVDIGRWLASDAMMLSYAAGWAIVPGAVVGLVLAVSRPRDRAERSFAAFAGAAVVLLLGEAAIYAANGSERFQERYLIAVLPLCPLLFCLGARRLDGKGTRIAVAAAAAVLALVAAVVPLSGYAALTGKLDSPTLWAVYELEQRLGTANGSLAVAVVATVLAALAAAATLRPRAATAATLAAGAAVLAAASVGAAGYDRTQSARTMLTFGDNAPSWVDASGVGPVAVLQTPYSSRVQISSQLFWNRSLTSILRMEPSSEVDAYGSSATSIAPDGRIVADGVVVRTPLLVEEYASRIVLDDARLVRRALNSALWVPGETEPRAALLFAGRYFDGLLGASSSITVWPGRDGRRTGVIELPLGMPADGPSSVIDVVGPGLRRAVSLEPGMRVVLRLPFDTTAPWTVRFRPSAPFWSGNRLLAARAGAPRLIETEAPNEQ